MKFSTEQFSNDFRSGFLELGDSLSRATLIQALGAYVVLRVDIKKYFNKNVEKITCEKPVIVTDEQEIIEAIELLADSEEGNTNTVISGKSSGVEYSKYFVIEKQKPDWRAAQALWEHELGKATQKAEVTLDAKVSLSELLS